MLELHLWLTVKGIRSATENGYGHGEVGIYILVGISESQGSFDIVNEQWVSL